MSSERLLSRAETLRLYRELSNWQRWGDADCLGTLNHVTGETRAAAAGLVSSGRVVSCAQDIAGGAARRWLEPSAGDVITGTQAAEPRLPAGTAGETMIADSVGFDYHGSAVTHLDALSHASYDGVGYGGRPLDQGWPATGADVAQAASGVVGRGVLLDIPRLLGVPRLEPGHAVTPGQIEEAERRQGVRLGRGDIMLLRTGHPARPPSAAPASPGRPGLHPESLRLVQERQVAVIGCDTPNDAKPCVVEPAALMPHPVHTIGLVSMGLWLLDNCALEELADACAALRRYQFFFVIGNLRLRGVTGSPVNPLAVF